MNETGQNCGANRREFLRGTARYALLAGLAAVSAVIAKRSGGRLTGQTCVNEGICRGCGAYDGCGLPQALSAKKFQSRSSRRKEAHNSEERGVHAPSASIPKTTSKRTQVRVPEET